MEEMGTPEEQYLDIEFDVNMTCNSCVHAINEALKNLNGIKSFDIDLPKQSVLVKTNLSSRVVQEALEKTGRKAVLKGFGYDKAAVAEIRGVCGVCGVVRFHQVHNETCIIDGTIDGLTEGEHGLRIHEYGDLSDGFSRIGKCFNPSGINNIEVHADQEKCYGDLGTISADVNGRANFRKVNSIIKVSNIIGRSLAVTYDREDFVLRNNGTDEDEGNSGDVLACAIIARSAGLFQNPKRLCQCDGISIWDEKVQSTSQESQRDAKL